MYHPAEAWKAPVPVRPSSFVPLRARHRSYNIEVALDRIGAFALAPAPLAPDEVLWSDMQTNVDANAPGRLGSGRAGVHAGRYVKGVGRTLLAANWNDPDDAYHASGYLSPSSALREHLVSRVLEARGAAHLIVPCEGLLFRTLAPEQRAILAGHGRATLAFVPPSDEHLLALSVKPGDFARMSNVVWALDHVDPSMPSVGRLFLDLCHHLSEPAARSGAAPTGAPDEIASALGAAADRAIRRTSEYFRHGVYWVSFHNNFTLDGRFLDLETPVFFGAPFFGVVRDARGKNGRPGRPHWVGFEVFRVARQWRLFVRYLVTRCRFLAAHVMTEAPGRAFLRDLARAIEAGVTRDHLLFSDDALTGHAVATIADTLALGAPERALVAELARAEARTALHGRPCRAPPVRLRPAAWTPAEPTPTGVLECLSPDFMADRAVDTSAGELFRAALERLEATTDLDTLLARVEDAERDVARAGA